MLNQHYELKRSPNDFKVSEDLDIEMSGQGEHLWLLVEKCNLTTDIARHLLGKVFGVPADQVSAAGKKDKHGITRQWMSVRLPGTSTARHTTALTDVSQFLQESPLYDGERLEIIESRLHHKKCQVGCHRGNFFEINALLELSLAEKLADTHAVIAFEQIADRLMQRGFANGFGEQRFGGVESIEDIETGLLRISKKTRPGRLKPREAWACSQARSFLFNRFMVLHLEAFAAVPQIGDVVSLRESGSSFIVTPDELVDIRERAAIGRLVVTGPLFGRDRALRAQGIAAQTERQVFEALDEAAQQKLLKFQEASRRPLIAWPQHLSLSYHSNVVRLKFWLPKGAYATECVSAVFDQLLLEPCLYDDPAPSTSVPSEAS